MSEDFEKAVSDARSAFQQIADRKHCGSCMWWVPTGYIRRDGSTEGECGRVADVMGEAYVDVEGDHCDECSGKLMTSSAFCCVMWEEQRPGGG